MAAIPRWLRLFLLSGLILFILGILALLGLYALVAPKLPDVQERLRSLGLEPVGSTPEEHAKQLRSDLERWAKLAKAVQLKID